MSVNENVANFAELSIVGAHLRDLDEDQPWGTRPTIYRLPMNLDKPHMTVEIEATEIRILGTPCCAPCVLQLAMDELRQTPEELEGHHQAAPFAHAALFDDGNTRFGFCVVGQQVISLYRQKGHDPIVGLRVGDPTSEPPHVKALRCLHTTATNYWLPHTD